MTYHHGWLYLRDADGDAHELINQARTAAYLQNPALAINGISVCDVLDFGGCAAYAADPPCGEDEGYAYFPGTSGNNLQTPDAAALDITGDISLVAKVALDDWSSAASQDVLLKWNTTGNQRSYILRVLPTGFMQLLWSTNGSDFPSANSTAVLPVIDLEWKWIAATLDVNDGAGNKIVRFWYSDNGSNWTQLGANVTTAGTTSIFASTAVVQVSGSGGAVPIKGKVAQAKIYNGILGSGQPGGTLVFHFDGELIPDESSTSFLAATGQTITVNRSGSPATVLNRGAAMWNLQSYVEPDTDPAPWYNANYPESADALGFYIEEWTGLDAGHVRRSTTPLGGGAGGAQFGKLAAGGRAMKLNVLAFARSERAMEYLYRWLETTLHSVCGSCDAENILIRRVCPTTDYLWEGVTELRQVALVEGPTWESDPLERGRCYLRRLSFTLMAADPCMYTDLEENVASDIPLFLGSLPAEAQHGRYPCRPECWEAAYEWMATISLDSLGASAPIIRLTSPATQPTATAHIVAFYDPLGQGIADFCGQEILGEIWLRSLPPSTEFVWDVLGRRLLYADPTTGGHAEGARFVLPNTPGVPRFFALPCGDVHFAMQLGSLCLESSVTGYVDIDGEGGFYLPGFRVDHGERMGCP